jgi:toxin-antitoxin system PIN domain toxin
VRLLDANILLYAYDSSSSHHATCRAWLEATLNAEETVALPWQTTLAFVRIATNPRATRRPLSARAACAIVESWLTRPNVAVVGPGERFWEIFRTQVGEAQCSGPLVTDTALAAVALEIGAVLCSTDRDFRRFKDLRVLDPLQPI